MKPLERSYYLHPISEDLIRDVMDAAPYLSRAAVIAELETEADAVEYWLNDTYQVAKRDLGEGCVHLNIRRRDGKVIMRDWRDFQAIKNQLCGEDVEAVELYPAESRLVDTSNKYHLWCLPPGQRFPFGFNKRDVLNMEGSTNGTRQRVRT